MPKRDSRKEIGHSDMEQEKKGVKKHHTFSLDSRKKGALTGVDEVLSYSETQLYLRTSEGDLSVTGKELKIVKYSTEDGTLSFVGQVDALRYAGQKVPFFKRVFK